MPPDKLTLYHFTNHRFLPAILRDGLTKGHVVLGERRILKGLISLTSSDRPEGLGINTQDELATEKDRLNHYLITQRWLPQGHTYWNKAAVRITLELPQDDPNLIPWARFRHRVERDQLQDMEHQEQPSTWFLYRGRIAPERFTAHHFQHGTEYREDEPA